MGRMYYIDNSWYCNIHRFTGYQILRVLTPCVSTISKNRTIITTLLCLLSRCLRSNDRFIIWIGAIVFELHQERLPKFDQLLKSVCINCLIKRPTSFWASTALSKNVSTPDLKSSTFSRSNLSSSPRIILPMSSNKRRVW